MAFTPIEPTIVEATGLHTSTLIFLHGVGDCGITWSHVLMHFRPNHNKLVCPTAAPRCSDSPALPGTSWFHIPEFRIHECEDEDGIKAGSLYVHSLIEKEIADGTPPERIVLGGYAIGGALALYSALTYHRPLAGVLMISGYLPLRKTFPTSLINSNMMPIYDLHGVEDVIKLEYAILSERLLQGFMENVNLKAYPYFTPCHEVFKDFEDILKILVP